MGRSIYVGIFLAIISAVCAVSIGLVDYYVSPIIAKREQEKLEETLSVIYPDASTYEDDTDAYQFGLNDYSTLNAIYTVSDETGAIAYVYKAVSKGRNDDIVILISIDAITDTIDDITYLSHGETPGRGDRIETPEYLDNILNGSVDDTYTDTLTGATISSSAVNNAINEALSHYRSEVGE